MNRSEGMTIAIALFALVLPQYMLRRTASRPFSISAILFTHRFLLFFLGTDYQGKSTEAAVIS